MDHSPSLDSAYSDFTELGQITGLLCIWGYLPLPKYNFSLVPSTQVTLTALWPPRPLVLTWRLLVSIVFLRLSSHKCLVSQTQVRISTLSLQPNGSLDTADTSTIFDLSTWGSDTLYWRLVTSQCVVPGAFNITKIYQFFLPTILPLTGNFNPVPMQLMMKPLFKKGRYPEDIHDTAM